MAHTMKISAILVVLLPTVLLGAQLRSSRVDDDPASNQQITAKYEQVDDFLSALFTMSCKWAHTDDMTLEAGDKLDDKEITRHELPNFMKKRQAENVKGLAHLCDVTALKGEEQCRQSCRGRHKHPKASTECDIKCTTVYGRFRERCKKESKHLEQVYEMNTIVEANKKKCRHDFCDTYPQVWEMSVEDAKTTVDTLCGQRCTENHVRYTCEEEWTSNINHMTAEIKSDCHRAQDGTMHDCVNGKSEENKAKQTQCLTDKQDKCATTFDECTAKAGPKGPPENDKAHAFCEERKTVCMEFSHTACEEKFKLNENIAYHKCQESNEKATTTCTEQTVEAKYREQLGICFKNEREKCNTECHRNCHVDRLTQCMANTQQDTDFSPTEDFCTDLWGLLHTTADVDPVTGDPVVLLSKAGQLKLGKWH